MTRHFSIKLVHDQDKYFITRPTPTLADKSRDISLNPSWKLCFMCADWTVWVLDSWSMTSPIPWYKNIRNLKFKWTYREKNDFFGHWRFFSSWHSLLDAAAEDADGRMRQRKCLFIIRTFLFIFTWSSHKKPHISRPTFTQKVLLSFGEKVPVWKSCFPLPGTGWAGRGAESGVKINVAITPESRISSNIFLVT